MATFSEVLGIVGGVCGCVSLGYLYKHKKLDEENKAKLETIADNINTTVNHLSTMTSVEVSDSIVNKAVSQAVQESVKDRVNAYSEEAVKAVRSDINVQVKDTLAKAYTNIEDEVKSCLNEQIGKMDVAEIRNDVTKQIKEDMEKHLQKDIDDILANYTDRLNDISKIYSTIAKNVGKTFAK